MLLQDKNALVFGVANNRSIAWAIAEELHAHGANVGLSYAIDKLERRVKPLADALQSEFVARCDVTSDQEIADTMKAAQAHFGKIDVLVHAIAYADMEELNRPYHQTSRAGFAQAMDVSVYSLIALTNAAKPLMSEGGSIMTMSYFGAEKVVPRYNVMGVAKSALESSVRYLAAELGPDNIRVNALSPGPIKTLSSGAFRGFRDMLGYSAERAPLRRNITQSEVGKSAVYLASDLSSGVTGEVIYVDGGYNILGLPEAVD